MLLVFLLAMDLGRAWNRMDSPDLSQRAADAALVRTAGVPVTPEGLREHLGKYHLTGSQRKEVLLWIEQLGSSRFAERETAQKRLIDAGPAILPLLRVTVAASPEQGKRLATCLASVQRRFDPALLEAVVRLHAGPEGASDLWRLLENCPDAAAEEETAGMLLRLAVFHSPLRAMVKEGAKSPFPAQRACAWIEQQNGTMDRTTWQHLREWVPHWPLCHEATPPEGERVVGPSLRARRTVTRFFQATERREPGAMLRLCHLPFNLGGRFTLLSTPEMQELLEQALDGLRGKHLSYAVLEAMRLETYGPSEEERTFLGAYSAPDVRVVRIRTQVGPDPMEDGYFFVLLRPQPRLLGIGAR